MFPRCLLLYSFGVAMESDCVVVTGEADGPTKSSSSSSLSSWMIINCCIWWFRCKVKANDCHLSLLLIILNNIRNSENQTLFSESRNFQRVGGSSRNEFFISIFHKLDESTWVKLRLCIIDSRHCCTST